MKAILLLTLSFLLSNSCTNSKSKGMENITLEYEYYSRGTYGKLRVNNKSILTYDKRDLLKPSTEKTISDSDWELLSKLVSELNLNAIATYKDPTQKRFYDGAPIAEFVIKTADKEYKTVAFDHGDPPVELKIIIDKINEIATQ